MLTNCLVCILHAGLYIIKYLYTFNSRSEIDFKFGFSLKANWLSSFWFDHMTNICFADQDTIILQTGV